MINVNEKNSKNHPQITTSIVQLHGTVTSGTTSSGSGGGRFSAIRSWLKQSRWKKKDKLNSKNNNTTATTTPTKANKSKKQ